MKTYSQACHQRLHNMTELGPDAALMRSAPTILGSLFAVSAAPDIPLSDVWLPWLFHPETRATDIKDLSLIHDAAMSCLQWQLQTMRDNQVYLLSEFSFSTEKNSLLAKWMQGLVFAHSQLDSVWREAWQGMLKNQHSDVSKLQKDLAHCLSVFSTFADIPFALEQARKKGNGQLVEKLPIIYRSLPEVLRLYVTTSGLLVDYLPHQFESFVQAPNSAS